VTVAGIGIDLIEIARIERALSRRPRMTERLFTTSERAYADARARPSVHLAARFCAKEAVAKSLGLRGWSFSEIEVVAGAPPAVKLRGRAAERARELGVDLCLSMTHSRETAAAVACAERAAPELEARADARAEREGV
jgi:holo-[acyl-carrier protein] synthase